MKRQDAHIIRYQDSLDQISKFYTGGTSLSNLNDTSKSSSIEYPKLFSPNISIPDSSFTTQIENTPQLEVYKEANENLQKENDQLKHEKDSLSDKIKILEKSISELTTMLRNKDWEMQQKAVDILNDHLTNDPTQLNFLCKDIWLNLIDAVSSPRTMLAHQSFQLAECLYRTFSQTLCAQTSQWIQLLLNSSCSLFVLISKFFNET